MALDTRDKRASAIGLGLPFRPLPAPDGVVGAGDRLALAFLFAGILAFADNSSVYVPNSYAIVERKAVTYVEVDAPYCSLTYGVAPCTAALGVTGEHKCFNTINTCQDRANFALAPVTFRFAMPTAYLPANIEAMPSIQSVDFSPGIISLGEDLGQRSSLSVTFKDHPHSDTGPGGDKYIADRDYDPYALGSFWGKWRARQTFLRGRPIRLIRGELGQTLAEMETRHFIIESFNGPGADGRYTITAKDVLKQLDGDRAVAPALSGGYLSADISSATTSVTLLPAGIGETYPASGYVAIGGKEICTFARSGDTFTLGRGYFNTDAAAHSSQDRVQVCLQYTTENAADIISDLMTTYAGIDPDWVPIDSWLDEVNSYNRQVYTALIAEPTPVRTLIAELIQQAGLAVWWDDLNQLIRLQVLRQIDTGAETFSDDKRMAKTFGITEQPDKRLSQFWTYYGQISPLRGVSDADNFRSAVANVDLEAEEDYGTQAIKKIFSRWIPEGGRAIAQRINDIQLGRFRDPPRRFSFSVFRQRSGNPTLGGGYVVEAWPLQDATGARASVPVQIVRLSPGSAELAIEAEEASFTSYDSGDFAQHVIVLETSQSNVNLRTKHDELYPAPIAGDEIVCIIEATCLIGSPGGGLPFDVGDWPDDVDITIKVRGGIVGPGGDGGTGQVSTGGTPIAATPGAAGGTAFRTRTAVTLLVESGFIWGGGGGGGGSGARRESDHRGGGGGGGAGSHGSNGGGAASPGGTGSNGSLSGGGAGGLAFTSWSGFVGPSPGADADIRGGPGGDPGEPGGEGETTDSANPGANGGAAGYSIDGWSYLLNTPTGNIRGPHIN